MGSFAMQKGPFRKSEAVLTLCGQGKKGFSGSIYRVASLQIKKNGMLNLKSELQTDVKGNLQKRAQHGWKKQWRTCGQEGAAHHGQRL